MVLLSGKARPSFRRNSVFAEDCADCDVDCDGLTADLLLTVADFVEFASCCVLLLGCVLVFLVAAKAVLGVGEV